MPKQVRVYNRIKSVLAENQKTSKWLAKEMEVTPGSVSRWCRNMSQPEVETLFIIANVLGVEAKDLLVYTEDSVPVKKKEKIKPKGKSRK
jgi:transcriptional regulator with XRE-family HTH domain